MFRREISAETLLIQWKKLHEINLQKLKCTTQKNAVTNVGNTYAKKSSKTSIKTVTRKTKKSMILEKSETKNKFLWMIRKATK